MYHQPYLEVIETVLHWDLPDEVLAEAMHQHFVQSTRNMDEDTWQPFEPSSLVLSHSL